MSWDITLGKTKPVEVDSHSEGGTYAMGGIDAAELNITYNYSKHYYNWLDKKEGLRWLADKPARETIKRLQRAVDALGTYRDKNYWLGTQGNAGYALSILLQWAIAHPNAKWIVC